MQQFRGPGFQLIPALLQVRLQRQPALLEFSGQLLGNRFVVSGGIVV
jgi:hypothetical protein